MGELISHSGDFILPWKDVSMRRFPQGSTDVADKPWTQPVLITHAV